MDDARVKNVTMARIAFRRLVIIGNYINDKHIAELHKAASAIEGRYHGNETRLGEIILFVKELRDNFCRER